VTETFLTVKEVAHRLSVGRTTVYELIAKRELTAIKIGRARRIPESALEKWISQQLNDKEVTYGQTRKQ
jgi:excisionase family DNA binding protein